MYNFWFTAFWSSWKIGLDCDLSLRVWVGFVLVCSNMKKDKKYFVDNLTCFVSRLKNSGGVDTIRTFTMSVMDSASSNPTSKASTLDTSASTEFGHNTIRSSSSTSSASFDLLTCDSSEDLNQFSTQDSETLSWPRTDHDSSSILDKPLESHNSQADFQNKVGMIKSTSLTRAINLEPGLRVINPVLRPVKTSVDTIAAGESAGPTPVVTLWLASQASNSDGVVNINPENHCYTASPTVSLLHPPSIFPACTLISFAAYLLLHWMCFWWNNQSELQCCIECLRKPEVSRDVPILWNLESQ